ncbi:restriction endonuclease subunit S [Microbacterium sp. KSW2-29]|uniref:Restriction endonuclease subunit S n=1 Tax=Microbacterium phycohabitans TaxID=3075993 RepID=A0ABU3SM06_9MICO|nr:restriction endonuclease subunit S [Microbacterium sp. KSW2-29]MDU0345405.1 restriction endonuclease subunit S [Microbacterium sp. KSW2-29]
MSAPWLGELPPGWQEISLRYLARVETGSRDTVDAVPGGEYPFIIRSQKPLEIDTYSYDTEAVLTAGDGAVGEIFHHVDGRFEVHQRVYVMHDFRGMHGRFFYYYFSSEFGQTVAYGGAQSTVASLRRPMFTGFPVAVPPLDVQRAIAGYLDRETGQIDAFIAKNKELITLLTERRDSVWSDLYMKAARTARPVPLRRFVSSIADGPFGSSLTSAHYSDAGTRVIRLGNIGINEFKAGDEAFVSDEYAATLTAHAAAAGDVIVAGLGDDRMPLGRACVLPDIGPAIVKADCYRVRPVHGLSSDFLAWVLSAPPTRGLMKLAARGSTRERLNTSVVLDVEVPIPDPETQAALVRQFASSASRIDVARSVAERGVALARERRGALISAAVTGKIDVGVSV